MEVRIQVPTPTAFPRKEIPVLSVLGGWANTRAGLGVEARGKSDLCWDANPVLQIIMTRNSSGNDDDGDNNNDNNKCNELHGATFFLRN
jgi:hypothetical protein